MKVLALTAILMLLIGCGGNVTKPPAVQPNTIRASDVFNSSMVGQTWTFVNGLGDNTFITIEAPAPQLSSSCVVFHYSKNRARAYWEPGSANADLEFVLCPRSDGAWVSPASLMQGDTDLAGNPAPWSATSNVTIIPSKDQAYVIIPASSTEGNKTQLITEFLNYNLNGTETFNSIVGDPIATTRTVTWRTDSYLQHTCVPFQNWCGDAMISEQWENCDSTWNGPQGCVHEKWYFAPKRGLIQVDLGDVGNGEGQGYCTLDLGVQECYTLAQASFKRSN
jgi:hypothetical protein